MRRRKRTASTSTSTWTSSGRSTGPTLRARLTEVIESPRRERAITEHDARAVFDASDLGEAGDRRRARRDERVVLATVEHVIERDAIRRERRFVEHHAHAARGREA